MRSYLDVARITGRKNLDGRLVAKAAAGLPFLLRSGMSVSLVPPVIDVPRNAQVEHVSSVSLDEAVISLSGVSDASCAELLVGCHILIDAAQLNDDEISLTWEIAPADLSGWQLFDQVTGRKGRIETSSLVAGQVLLDVKMFDEDEGVAHLVPFADDLIVGMDEDRMTVTMRCPAGIFDI